MLPASVVNRRPSTVGPLTRIPCRTIRCRRIRCRGGPARAAAPSLAGVSGSGLSDGRETSEGARVARGAAKAVAIHAAMPAAVAAGVRRSLSTGMRRRHGVWSTHRVAADVAAFAVAATAEGQRGVSAPRPLQLHPTEAIGTHSEARTTPIV